MRIYKFDNKLRFLLLEILERVEKSFKCRLAHELSIASGTGHWYLSANFFVDNDSYNAMMEVVSDEVSKSKEICITHYLSAYSDPVLPPIWNVVEILSFGQCIKIFNTLKREHRIKIAQSFDEDEQFVRSWMLSLSVLRNYCAHYSRLWNRNPAFPPKINHKVYEKFFNQGSNRLFNHLVALQIILSKINPTTTWVEKLKEFIKEYKIGVQNMGFPIDWENRFNEIMLIK